MTQRLITFGDSKWIEDSVTVGGKTFRTAVCPADWKWRSAQPLDEWHPKPRKAGKEVQYTDAMGRPRTVHCAPLVIMQHHNADKAAMVRDSGGQIRLIKWASLKRHWLPVTERKLPAVRRAA